MICNIAAIGKEYGLYVMDVSVRALKPRYGGIFFRPGAEAVMTGPFGDDPYVTDKRFPGNPTLSYRSREPSRILGEVGNRSGHPAAKVREMKEGVPARKRRARA